MAKLILFVGMLLIASVVIFVEAPTHGPPSVGAEEEDIYDAKYDEILGLAVMPEQECDVQRPSTFRKVVRDKYPSRHKEEEDRDHRVPWNEALKSGLCGRDEQEQRDFYNDVDNIWYLDSHVNQNVKGDKDFGQWVPETHVCEYFQKYFATKRKWGLTVDTEEAEALHSAFTECSMDHEHTS